MITPSPARKTLSPPLATLVPANIVPDKLEPNIPVNMARKPLFYSFFSVSFVSLTLFINRPASSRDLIIVH